MVPQSYKDDPPAGYWVRTQRVAHRNKTITDEHERLLNYIGFVWNSSATWEEMYQRLVAYNKVNKDTNVPQKYKEDPRFGRWVHKQRFVHKNKKMTEERKYLLNSIGFVWNLSPTWEEMYQRLVAYKKEHMHTNVPQRYKEDPQLGRWVGFQRITYKKKTMTADRKHLLDSIRFELELPTKNNKAIWEEMYQRLVAYKKEHMHTNVPQCCKEDSKLGFWVHNQRTAYKKKTMTEERKRLLDSIRFESELPTKNNKALWERIYQRLVAYKKEHMHTNVPNRYKEDPKLGRWVDNQRVASRKKKMTEERKRLLNSIGFEWESSTKIIKHHGRKCTND